MAIDESIATRAASYASIHPVCMHSFIHSFVEQHADALMKETIEKKERKATQLPPSPASHQTRILDASHLISFHVSSSRHRLQMCSCGLLCHGSIPVSLVRKGADGVTNPNSEPEAENSMTTIKARRWDSPARFIRRTKKRGEKKAKKDEKR